MSLLQFPIAGGVGEGGRMLIEKGIQTKKEKALVARFSSFSRRFGGGLLLREGRLYREPVGEHWYCILRGKERLPQRCRKGSSQGLGVGGGTDPS